MFHNKPFLCIVSICLTLQAVNLKLLLTARICLGAAQMSAAGSSARSRKIFPLSHHIKLQRSRCHLRRWTLSGFITLVLVHALVLGWSQSHCWISNTLSFEFYLVLFISLHFLVFPPVTSIFFFVCSQRTWLGLLLRLLRAHTWYLALPKSRLQIEVLCTASPPS